MSQSYSLGEHRYCASQSFPTAGEISENVRLTLSRGRLDNGRECAKNGIQENLGQLPKKQAWDVKNNAGEGDQAEWRQFVARDLPITGIVNQSTRSST